jgi:hypothetical protein
MSENPGLLDGATGRPIFMPKPMSLLEATKPHLAMRISEFVQDQGIIMVSDAQVPFSFQVQILYNGSG